MTLHWGAAHISKCIPPELQAKLNEGICCDPYYEGKDLSLPHYNAKTGEKLFDMPGEEPRRISRRKLRNFLSQGLDVQYGKKLSTITADGAAAKAEFTDGTAATGTLIVGCDGANSVVRECLVGKEAAQVEDLDIQMFNVCCRFDEKTANLQRMGHPCFKNCYHPDGFMWWQSIQDVQDPDKPETWLFQNILSWVGKPRAEDFPDQASRLAFWREKAKTFADPWKTVGEKFPDNLNFGIDRTTVWRPTVDWSKSELGGKVTLAGDVSSDVDQSPGLPKLPLLLLSSAALVRIIQSIAYLSADLVITMPLCYRRTRLTHDRPHIVCLRIEVRVSTTPWKMQLSWLMNW